MRIFISQPMHGYTRDEILEERKRIQAIFKGNEFIDSCIEKVPVMTGNSSVWCLGESIKMMKDAELVVVPTDHYCYRGCAIEHDVAVRYGIPICEINMYTSVRNNGQHAYKKFENVCIMRGGETDEH